jgi:hypothetical protein
MLKHHRWHAHIPQSLHVLARVPQSSQDGGMCENIVYSILDTQTHPHYSEDASLKSQNM